MSYNRWRVLTIFGLILVTKAADEQKTQQLSTSRLAAEGNSEQSQVNRQPSPARRRVFWDPRRRSSPLSQARPAWIPNEQNALPSFTPPIFTNPFLGVFSGDRRGFVNPAAFPIFPHFGDTVSLLPNPFSRTPFLFPQSGFPFPGPPPFLPDRLQPWDFNLPDASGSTETNSPNQSIRLEDVTDINVPLSASSFPNCGRQSNISVVLRIMGGEEAIPHSWPFVVALKAGGQFCAGTLIRPDVVLTAAHCIATGGNPTLTRVAAAAHDVVFPDSQREVLRSVWQTIHPGFSLFPPVHDIALLQLERSVVLDDRKQTSCLPATGQAPTPGSNCVIVGWGKTDNGQLPGRLQQAVVPVVSQNTCRRFYPGDLLRPQMLCAGDFKTGARPGDSGGPLLCKSGQQWIASGIISWGGSEATRQPSVYTSVAEYTDWISEQLSIIDNRPWL